MREGRSDAVSVSASVLDNAGMTRTSQATTGPTIAINALQRISLRRAGLKVHWHPRALLVEMGGCHRRDRDGQTDCKDFIAMPTAIAGPSHDFDQSPSIARIRPFIC